MLVRLEHSRKALSPIIVTLSGIVMLVRLEQPLKASSPILVTLFGIVMLVRLVQPSKALSPILVTLFPSIVSGITTASAPVSQLVICTVPSSST